jgi:hypothetical protein
MVALVVSFAGHPVSRALNRLLLEGLGSWSLGGFLLLGFAGIVVVAIFLEAEEMSASLAGFVGGLMIWRGFFDGPLRFFGDYFAMPPIEFGGYPLGGRYALLMSTSTIMLALLLLYGFVNRETKCAFMRFSLGLSRWSPGNPTPGLKRSYARIAAMETVFVQWGIYLLFLFLGGWIPEPFYLAMLAWSIYLLWQLSRRKRPADAFRYAIPVAVIVWSLAEVGAFFGMYPEVWQAPVEYPVSNLVILAIFVAGLWWLLKVPDRGHR